VFESNDVRIPRQRRTSPRPARQPTSTKWGDREQRRLDILDAARQRIAESGYLSLNMRDLAATAGISPATLYSYFATKEELFATLYAHASRRHTETFQPVADAGHDLATLLTEVIEHHLDLYRTYGRHFTLWSAIRRDVVGDTDPAAPANFPRELIDELRSATLEQSHLLMQSIRDAAARDGRHVVDERLVPSFLWSALTGLADHFTTERRALDPFPAQDLVDFAASRLALAITEPLDPPEAPPGRPTRRRTPRTRRAPRSRS
jgi:AcrR family transcriptional regulator